MKKEDVNKIYENESDTTRKIFAQRLINLRKKRGLTQSELADKVGIQQSAYARYEKGKFMPRAETVRKIAEVLEVSEAYLINTQDVAAHILEDSEVIDISMCILKDQINTIPFELVKKRICEWMTKADPTTLRYMVYLVEALQSKEMGNEIGFLYDREFVETHLTHPSTPGTKGKEVYTEPESMFYAMTYFNGADEAIEHLNNLGFNIYGQKFLDMVKKLDEESRKDAKENKVQWFEEMCEKMRANEGIVTKPLFNDYGQSFEILRKDDEKFDKYRDSDDFDRAWRKAQAKGEIPIINLTGEELEFEKPEVIENWWSTPEEKEAMYQKYLEEQEKKNKEEDG